MPNLFEWKYRHILALEQQNQPEEPKAPNTSSHIPVRIAIEHINSQEDA